VIKNYFKAIAAGDSEYIGRTGTPIDCFPFDPLVQASVDTAYTKALKRCDDFQQAGAKRWRVVVWKHLDTHRRCKVIGETEGGAT